MSVKKSKKKGDATLHCLEQKAKKFHQPLYVYYVAYGHSLHYLRREKEVLTAVFFRSSCPYDSLQQAYLGRETGPFKS